MLKDNEIIEALERCPSHRECCFCNSVEECGSKRVLTTSALDLIKRKDAEIDILIRKKETLRDEIAEQQAEIERLREELIVKDYKEIPIKMERVYRIGCGEACVEAIKAEAYKEFAEKLKQKGPLVISDSRGVRVMSWRKRIDNILAEMESERK